MILPRPQVVAIDDEPEHLDGLVKGLALCGVASLPVLYRSESEEVRACPHVRVIFADLHLGVGTPSDHTQDFSTIGGLLEDRIQPTGPYMIVLWTRFADQARRLEEFLRRVKRVPAPFAVRALDKSEFLDEHGRLKNAASLVRAVERCVREEPQLGALLNWEGRVLDAAAESVASIAELARTNDTPTKNGLGGVLRSLAAAGVGKSRVSDAPFRGVNDALVPILADRIAFLESLADEDDLWREAIGVRENGQELDEAGSARLNRLLHIDSAVRENREQNGGRSSHCLRSIRETRSNMRSICVRNRRRANNFDTSSQGGTTAPCDGCWYRRRRRVTTRRDIRDLYHSFLALTCRLRRSGVIRGPTRYGRVQSLNLRAD